MDERSDVLIDMARRVWKRIKLSVYGAAVRLLPRELVEAIGGSTALASLRDRFFRPSGLPEIVGGVVTFEQTSFYFASPYQAFTRAKRRGIEGTLSRLILSVIDEGAVCVDVGANFGFISMLMATVSGPSGKVLSFEAVPFIADVLQESIRENALEDVCRVYPVAVSSEETTLEVAFGRHRFTAPATTLDRVWEEEGVERLDLIKIDTDGSDFRVLCGARDVIRRFHPVVIVEMTEQEDAIFRLLSEAGYTHLLDMQGQPVVPGAWPPNLIASMQEITR